VYLLRVAKTRDRAYLLESFSKRNVIKKRVRRHIRGRVRARNYEADDEP